jgi:hypothetical protein
MNKGRERGAKNGLPNYFVLDFIRLALFLSVETFSGDS